MRSDLGQIVRAMLVGVGVSIWGWGIVQLVIGYPLVAFLFMVAGFTPVLLERALKELGIGEAERR